MSGGFEIAMLIFPDMTNLDFAGPFEVFAKLPGTGTRIVWKDLQQVRCDSGLLLQPTHTLDQVTCADLLFVPGGPGQMALMDDDQVLAFLRRIGAGATWVTSVCTGALVLGAAGLLDGYKAATHWLSMDQLPLFGAEPVQQRVVVDRNRITGGGVTAGIDFALTIAALLHGPELAQRFQLGLEYNPQPPFDSGSPDRAPPELVAAVRARAAPMGEKRRAISEQAAARLRDRPEPSPPL